MESLTRQQIRMMIPKRRAEQSKKDFGRLLVFAGSKGMAGAAVMCGTAALRTGAGLCTFFVPEDLYPILQAAVPEATCADRGMPGEGKTALFRACTALAAGPGLGRHAEDEALLREMLATNLPIVLDADALNDIVRYELYDAVKTRAEREDAPSVIMTPHEGEACRLLGTDRIEVREAAAGQLAERFGAVVVLKGHRTLIASPDGRLAVNPTGCPAMAKGGSGDVLTGMAGAFLAKGTDAFNAACCACWLHGKAGELACGELGEESVLARDLIEAIPRAFLALDRESDT